MDRIDNILRKKYKKEKCPEFVMHSRENNKVKLYIFSSVCICVVLTLIFIKMATLKNSDNDSNITNNNVAENVEKSAENLPIANEKLNISTDIASISSFKPEIIAVVKVNKIISYTNYSEKYNQYSLPITKAEIENVKLLKGNNFDKLIMNKLGGIVSILDYEKSMSERQKENSIYRNMTEEEKKNTYIEITTSLSLSMADIMEGKLYLVALRKDDYYGDYNTYVFYEYDIDSGKIINKNTKEKEDIPKFLSDYINK